MGTSRGRGCSGGGALVPRVFRNREGRGLWSCGGDRVVLSPSARHDASAVRTRGGAPTGNELTRLLVLRAVELPAPRIRTRELGGWGFRAPRSRVRSDPGAPRRAALPSILAFGMLRPKMRKVWCTRPKCDDVQPRAEPKIAGLARHHDTTTTTTSVHDNKARSRGTGRRRRPARHRL